MSDRPALTAGRLIAVLGPTNTGKTHFAIERLLAHDSGIIGFPLRLLAREVYDRVVAARGSSQVALITGEEKIMPLNPRYFLCTIEAMPTDRDVAFLAIDEAQMAADPERGHVFTQRLLRARGRVETLILGSATLAPLLKRLYPGIEVRSRPRFSTLSYGGVKKLSRLPRRSAVVGFSAHQVYGLAELIRRQRGGAAIVMGALSPRTRNAQVAMYQSGEVDYLVATDAIGMGLNMDIKLVAFASTHKFDGRRQRHLTPAEMGQIAGRAGRYSEDGTFVALAQSEEGRRAPLAGGLDDELVSSIENHNFETIRRLYWRNADLDMRSVKALCRSLEMPPQRADFHRAPPASDLTLLKILARDDNILTRADSRQRVKMLWDCCRIPDFRKLSIDDHARLVGQIFMHLSAPGGHIPTDWIASQLAHLDIVGGDIDTLAARIAGIRVWTYVAHQSGWLADATHWAERTRAIEDRLSDALHDRLTQRFVDRRTTMLMRELRQRGEVMVEVETAAEGDLGGDHVIVDGETLGRLHGFRFHVDATAGGEDFRRMRAAGERVLRGEMETRVRALLTAADEQFTLDLSRGFGRARAKWRGVAIADLVKGDELLRPRVKLPPDLILTSEEASAVELRLQKWIDTRIEELLRPLIDIDVTLKAHASGKAEVALSGTSRAVAYQLMEHFGVLPRKSVEAEVKALDQAERRGLRHFGIRFGSLNLFIAGLLKPAATDLRLMLWALNEKLEDAPLRPTPGMVWVEMAANAPQAFYRVAGFHPTARKAVRVDMIERLGDGVRPLGQGNANFEVSPELMGLVGVSGEDFIAVMAALGYGTREVPESERPTPPPQPHPQPEKPTQNEPAPEAAERVEAEASDEKSEETPAPVEANAESATTSPIAPPEPVAVDGSVVEQPNEAASLLEKEPETNNPPTGEGGTAIEDQPEAEAISDTPTEPEGTVTIFFWRPQRIDRSRGARGERAEYRKQGPKGQRGQAKAGPGKGGHSKGGDRQKGKSRTPKYAEKPIDPNNPFAVLAGLKDTLNKK
ncbi:MAG: helicase-related protein [Pseudomonadota bacterium]